MASTKSSHVAALPRRSARNLKSAAAAIAIKTEEPDERSRKRKPAPATTTRPERPAKRPATTTASPPLPQVAAKKRGPVDKAALLQARKLQSFAAFARRSPFPSFARPTPSECALAHGILARLHGDRARPEKVLAPTASAGCGNSPSVLDALVRTVLSQNTSNINSSRAKQSMDAVYGGSDRWDAIVAGGEAKLERAIRSGGLSVVKSRVIIGILQQAKAQHGVYSLDHLFAASDEDAMREMLSFPGVGPKTASCVLLFCLQRASFAVDTHVYRLTGMLGWRPAGASREEAQAHLDATVPDDEKYPLHVLLISHGKQCSECKAGGKNLGKCELRKAFREARHETKVTIKGEAEAMKKEVIKNEKAIKKESIKKEAIEKEAIKKEEDAH